MYNVEKFLAKCILSCENQDISKNEYEIICVNDGSPDNSFQIAETLALQYPNIKVISQPNRGLSAARNTGICCAQGDYIFFVDSDDWIEEKILKKISCILKSEKPDVLCICAANVYETQLQRRMDYKNYKAVSGPESMLSLSSCCAPFQIVRKAFLDEYKIRFCEGIYHEDTEYTPRMRYFAKKVCYMNDIVYYVYQNPNSITRTVNTKKVYDVITVVAPNIHNFAEKEVTSEYRPKYNEIIASSINNTLTCNYPLSKKDKHKINKILAESRYLYDDYCHSRLWRHRIMGWLFKLFPNNPIEIFSLMKLRFC